MPVIVDTKEINLNVPIKLLEELQLYLPNWQEEQFLLDLLERELRRVRLQQAWEQSAGVWSDEDHPDLKTAEDIEAYIRQIRETGLPRTWDEIAAEGADD